MIFRLFKAGKKEELNCQFGDYVCWVISLLSPGLLLGNKQLISNLQEVEGKTQINQLSSLLGALGKDLMGNKSWTKGNR